jgi:hypothetical protein
MFLATRHRGMKPVSCSPNALPLPTGSPATRIPYPAKSHPLTHNISLVVAGFLVYCSGRLLCLLLARCGEKHFFSALNGMGIITLIIHDYLWTVPSGMMAPFNFVFFRFAPSRCARSKVAPPRSASVRLVPIRLAPVRFAFDKVAPDKSAPSRSAFSRFALNRFAPFIFAPLRSAAVRSAYGRFNGVSRLSNSASYSSVNSID